jgi:hypothetical protein
MHAIMLMRARKAQLTQCSTRCTPTAAQRIRLRAQRLDSCSAQVQALRQNPQQRGVVQLQAGQHSLCSLPIVMPVRH